MTEDKITVVPKSVLKLAETLRKCREDGVTLVVSVKRKHSMTWAQQILDAEDAEINEQKQISNG